MFDYVTVAPGYAALEDAAKGPLAPGRFGLVLVDDCSDNKPLKVSITMQQMCCTELAAQCLLD